MICTLLGKNSVRWPVSNPNGMMQSSHVSFSRDPSQSHLPTRSSWGGRRQYDAMDGLAIALCVFRESLHPLRSEVIP